jgi:hypothetical protein
MNQHDGAGMPHKIASAELYSVPLRVCQKIMCLVQ